MGVIVFLYLDLKEGEIGKHNYGEGSKKCMRYSKNSKSCFHKLSSMKGKSNPFNPLRFESNNKKHSKSMSIKKPS